MIYYQWILYFFYYHTLYVHILYLNEKKKSFALELNDVLYLFFLSIFEKYSSPEKCQKIVKTIGCLIERASASLWEL